MTVSCEERPATVVPLDRLEPGDGCIVRAIDGGAGLAQRLAAMGLFPGVRLRVVRCIGPMIVEAMDNRLILGRGMVHHVLVEPDRM